MHTGANYVLTITPPAGTNTGESHVSITVTDPFDSGEPSPPSP